MSFFKNIGAEIEEAKCNKFYKVGTYLKDAGVLLKVEVVSESDYGNTCRGCYFVRSCTNRIPSNNPLCYEKIRDDKTNVIFKAVDIISLT